ncbi:hypothetical protein GGF41_002822, partial [Coemansia sp. RSA 2531]
MSYLSMVDNEFEQQVVLGGVVQDSSLSPLINYMIDKAPGLVHKEGLRACAAHYRIGVIAFANDIATVARSPDETQSILDMMSTFAAAEQKITWAPENVGITHSGGNLNWVIGMCKAFIRPTMEYALEICIPNALLIKVMERCKGDVLHVMLRVPKSTSYVAILLLCKMETMETMEHRWCAKISSCIRRRQLDTDNKHILNGQFDVERIAQMKISPLIPQLCQEAYCAGSPHRITMTIGEKKQACVQALRSALWRFNPHNAKSVAGLYLATMPQTASVPQLSLALSLQMLSTSY